MREYSDFTDDYNNFIASYMFEVAKTISKAADKYRIDRHYALRRFAEFLLELERFGKCGDNNDRYGG